MTILAILFAVMSINVFLSLVFNQAINFIWTLLNSLQLIMTLPLTNIVFPMNA